jgi:hypothetical protein
MVPSRLADRMVDWSGEKVQATTGPEWPLITHFSAPVAGLQSRSVPSSLAERQSDPSALKKHPPTPDV